MKKVFGVITTIAAIGVGAVAGKVIYDALQDKKKREEFDREFLNDIEDDFFGFSEASGSAGESSSAKETVSTIAKEAAKVAAKQVEASTAPKAPTATKKVDVSKTKTSAPKKTNDKAKAECKKAIDAAANVLGVTADEILSKSRKGEVASARRVAIYVCSTELKIADSDICDGFGGIGSSTVANAKKNVADKIKADDDFAADVEDVIDEVNS